MDILTTAMDLIDLTTTYPDDDYSGPNNTGNYSNYEDEWIPNADEIPYLINVTRDVPIKYAMPLFGYMMPFLLLITLIANTLIVIVLAQKHMRTPTNLVLLAMAISDLLTLLFPAPWYFYMYTLNNHSKILFPTALCYAYHCMIETIPAFFHTASIWLTLLLAVQRYIYVCHPTTARTCCTVPKVWNAMGWIYFFALIHQSTRFFDRIFQSIRFRWEGELHEGCMSMTADWVSETITENIYYTGYYGFRILFVHVGPCLALVIFNVLLFSALRKAQMKRDKLFKENRKSECKKLRDSNCTTLMLIVVVTVFLVVEIPMAVTTLLHVMQNALDLHIADYDDLNTTILFINFLIILSYPVNFAIYCGMSRQFRETFKDLFLQGRIPSAREGSSRYSLVNGPRTSTNETIL
ncbi:sex peptide receptor [Trichonephila clavipes]|uniref:Sex peptide receptor n=1 Tax=Trichonephila inaurata madagascariensis TaxID=2747483 RepID=A0A8X6XIW9_9ARAC|nr:sex peptide receptor [Trichonephila clavipes]GFY54712.1 sex peptide receptor [Trichonephila inaurata madagascariensis]